MTPISMVQVSWYEDLPPSWVTGRIKSVSTRVTDGAHISPDTNGGAFDFVSTRDLKDGAIDFAGSLKTSPATYEYMVRTGCKPWRGDLLFSKDGTVGATALVDDEHDFVVASSLIIVSPNRRRILPRFLLHAFSARPVIEQARTMTRGAGLPRLSVGNLARIEIPLPPLDEQRIIIDFLDRETAQIDALVAKQEEFVALLRERREALSDAEIQPVEGKRRTTIRQALVRLIRTPRSGLGVVTAYRDGVVTLRANRRADGYTMSEAEAGYQEVRPGDIVFHALDGFAGAVGISDSLGQCSPVYHVCRPRYDDDSRYLALLIRYLGTSGFLSTQAPSTRQRSVDFRNWGTFARVPLMLPSVEHQMAFVAEFRRQETGMGSLIAKAQEHIVLAKERRAALITAAVTGQIGVRIARKAG
jgi:type I restriction enzyme S subunit